MSRERADGVAVPPADFRSYYGRPVVKAPVWKADVAAYLFTGGLAAGASLLAAGADATGRPGLRRASRLTSAGAVGASAVFLIRDLGRPSRFANMLRVFKPTSPMSMGTWILAGFGPAAGLAALAELAPALPRTGTGGVGRRVTPIAGTVAGWASAALAPLLGTYTAVLLADTAVPAWHEAWPYLPAVFAGSALASGGGAGLLLAPAAEVGPARRMAVVGAAAELSATAVLEHRLGLQSEAYRSPGPARLLNLARGLTLAGAAGAILGRGRLLGSLSGAALLAGSACSRFGVYRAGVVSARDPRYTIVPQRQRLDDREGRQGAPSDDGRR